VSWYNISENKLLDIVERLIRKANTVLPKDIVQALKRACEAESSSIACSQLENILLNVELAQKKGLPICQDTGVPIFFVDLPKNFNFDYKFDKIIATAIKNVTKELPLRPNVVDPITRKNTGSNTGMRMPFIFYELTDKNYLKISFLPKGAGSENMSKLCMLSPASGLEGIENFVVETVKSAKGNPCPPIIVGVGIGGSADICMKLAKRSLLRKIGSTNPNPRLNKLEQELLIRLNKLGIGPMGLGGESTCLAVHIELADCHTASLPVGINIQCWAARKSEVTIYPDGKVIF
jgi:fumarate hydratase subunit alpha